MRMMTTTHLTRRPIRQSEQFEPPPLRPASPVFDAVMIRREAVVDPPEDGLRPAADIDLAVDRADVGLHGVGAEVGQLGDLGVALALGDKGQDLGLPIAESFASTGPVEPDGAARTRRNVADDHLSGMHRLQRGDQFARRKCLRQVAVGALSLALAMRSG